MNIAILTELYPEEGNLYSGMYIHTRISEYQKNGNNCIVFRSANCQNREYIFEGIKVYLGNKDYILSKIKNYSPDIFCLHAPNPGEKLFIIKNFPNAKTLCWIHGLDTMSGAFSYQYTGNFLLHPFRFILRAYEDIRKIITWHLFIDRMNPRMIFVSEWMKRTAQNFLFKKINNSTIIPNPIDEDIFKFKQRDGIIKKIICVRPHDKRKGSDIAVKAFKNSKYTLDFYGKGELLKKNKELAKKINSNVIFYEKWFASHDLNSLLNNYDLAVMPTRMDAQGVSVCEMNMNGLVVITSDLPLGHKEYATRGTFFLPHNNFNVEKVIDKINKDNSLKELSLLAHQDMMKLSSKQVVIAKELQEISNQLL